MRFAWRGIPKSGKGKTGRQEVFLNFHLLVRQGGPGTGRET